MFRSKDGMPSGYRLDGSGIDPEEVYRLFRDVEAFDDDDEALVAGPDWEELMIGPLAVVGARDYRRRLVGVGFLDGDRTHAELDNLAVHPKHRHQGIGRVLVRERVQIAKDIRVQTITTKLSSANTLGPFYRQLGFQPTDHSSILELNLPENFFRI